MIFTTNPLFPRIGGTSSSSAMMSWLVIMRMTTTTLLLLLLLPGNVTGQGAQQACTDEYCFCVPENDRTTCPNYLIGKIYCDETNTNYINLCYSLWEPTIVPYHLCFGSLQLERWSFIQDVNLITEKTLWTCTNVDMCNANLPKCQDIDANPTPPADEGDGDDENNPDETTEDNGDNGSSGTALSQLLSTQSLYALICLGIYTLW